MGAMSAQRSHRSTTKGSTSAGFNPWDSGSPVYRRTLLTGMAVIGVGIVLAILGAITQVMTVSYIALAVIVLGLGVHLCAQWSRFRQASRERRERGGGPR